MMDCGHSVQMLCRRCVLHCAPWRTVTAGAQVITLHTGGLCGPVIHTNGNDHLEVAGHVFTETF